MTNAPTNERILTTEASIVQTPFTSSHPLHIQHKNLPLEPPPSSVENKMSGRFEPKTPVTLNPPKDDPISLDYLAKCDGTCAHARHVACTLQPPS